MIKTQAVTVFGAVSASLIGSSYPAASNWPPFHRQSATVAQSPAWGAG
jgi:hypothetical protein